MRKILMACAACAALLTGAAAPPPLPITDLRALPLVSMRPYDEAANADAMVAAAFARARKNGKRVLLDLGGNWCPDCIVLANLMRLPQMKKFLDAHYEIVAVDMGRFDRNQQIPARFGYAKRLDGVPAILVATPDGRLLNRGQIFALSEARTMTPQSLAAYLAKWTP